MLCRKCLGGRLFATGTEALCVEIRPVFRYAAGIMFMNLAVRCLLLGFAFTVGLFAEAYAAEQRVALVIGNGAYRSVPELRNSRNDADDISEQLKRLGFAVIDGRDLDRSAMQTALSRFAQRLRGSEAGLVYYSGHGLQINGQNFLVPVDLKMDGGAFTPFELVKLDDVIEALSYTDGVRLLVLDACRDNPFANVLAQSKGSRGAGMTRGLAKIERSQGMLIAYSTQSNAVAADGYGRNSPFTSALVREMQVPGLEVATVFRRVAVNVNRETAGAQTPELSVSLLQDFYLNPQESDVSAWQRLGPSASVADLKTFIAKFPTSVMVDAARARLEAIENANERERLVREYAEKERRLRQQLETVEAGYRKAASELAERGDRERQRPSRRRVAGACGHECGQPPGDRSWDTRRQGARAADKGTGRQRTGSQCRARAASVAGCRFRGRQSKASRRAPGSGARDVGKPRQGAGRTRAGGKTGRCGNRPLAGLCSRSAADDD